MVSWAGDERVQSEPSDDGCSKCAMYELLQDKRRNLFRKAIDMNRGRKGPINHGKRQRRFAPERIMTWNLIVSPLELLKSRHNRLFLGNKGSPGGDRDLVGVAARIMVDVLVLKVVAKVIVVSCVGLFFARHDLG